MTDQIVPLTTEDFEEAIRSSPSPMLVDFWAEWCGPCAAYEPIVAEVASEGAGRYRVGRVDIAADPELAERCGVRTIPALVLFQDGEITKRIFGARGKRVLLAEIDRMLF
jgi:thioredoxin 1